MIFKKYYKRIKVRLKIWFHFWRKFFKYGGFKKYGFKWIWSKQELRKVRKNFQTKKENIRSRRVYGSFVGNRKAIKSTLIAKSGRRCEICNKRFPKEQLTIDHIKSLKDGGTNELKNLQLLCRPCHEIKDGFIKVEELKPLENFAFKDAFEKLNIK